MMRQHLLLLFYVLSTWGASLNFPAWLGLTLRRLREPTAPPRRRDTILFVRFGLTILSFGIAGLAGMRTVSALLDDTPIPMPSMLGLLFIGCMAVAEPFFLAVDEVHSNARGGRSCSWRLYWAGAVAAVATFAILTFKGA